MWYQNLKQIKSLGQTTERPGSLAGLSEARKKHLSQFFTPETVTGLIWHILENMADPIDQPLFLADNSIGVGSLMWPANKDKHRIIGFDKHGESVDALCEELSKEGFLYEVEQGDLETCSLSAKVHCHLINPPFSVSLQSPRLQGLPCTCYGKYGPNTSAISHFYALEQALNTAHATIAVLPKSFVVELIDTKQYPLKAVYHLPNDAFIDQGVQWPMAVCVFSGDEFDVDFIEDNFDLESKPVLIPEIKPWPILTERPRIINKAINKEAISIPLPYTGDNSVRVTHNGRNIKLHYKCGLMMAKVENAIMKKRAVGAENQRLPSYVKFSGSGVLDIEIHLMQNNPMASFERNLLDQIRNQGGHVEVEPGLIGYISSKVKKLARIKEPFALTVLSDGTGIDAKIKATAKYDVLVDQTSMLSPVIDKGAKVELVNKNGAYFYECDERSFEIDEHRLLNEFDAQFGEVQWIQKHKGKAVAFPEQARMWRTRLEQLRIHEWLTRDYQINDLIETMINPSGSVCAWGMGLGKTYFGVSCILLSGVKHGLIVLKPSLIGEFIRQIKEDLSEYVSMDDVNVIKSPDDLKNLKKYNFIGTNKLRSLVNEKQSKVQTYAHKLRRRIGLMICDEGHFLANMGTAQSRSICQVAARKTIVMSGTIIANYPRNLHSVLCITGGDGTAHQPWGYRRAKLNASFINSMDTAFTGPKAFKDHYCTVVWCTYSWEDQEKGARREIPRIKNVADYRNMVSGFIKRRVLTEPDVTKYIKIPEFTIRNEFLDWNIDHLAYYLKVARDFASVWKRYNQDKKAIASLLPRIQAVVKAANTPFLGVKGMGSYDGQTTKDRRAIEIVNDWSNQGEKALVFVYSPAMAERLEESFSNAGVSCFTLHGGKTIKSRNKMIELFKKDDTDVLIATIGTLSEGHNLEVASKVLVVNRSWSHKTEEQCYSRVLRPKQTKVAEIVFLHYSGGICEYQKNLVDFKADAVKVGIDYASPECDGEFLHMEQIFHDFVEDLPELEKQMLEELAA